MYPTPYPHEYGIETPASRPGSVVASLVLTYLGAGVMVLFGLLLLLGAANRRFVTAAATGLGITGASAMVIVVVALTMLAVGALLILLAAFAQRGGSGARAGLSAVGVVVVVLDLVELVRDGKPATVLNLVWVAAAVALLWTGPANAWYRSMRRR